MNKRSLAYFTIVFGFIFLHKNINAQDTNFINYLRNTYDNAPRQIDETITYDDSLEVLDFDFNSLTPSGKRTNQNTFFKIYNKDKQIKKVSYFSDNYNFDATFSYKNNEVIFCVFNYKNSKRELKEGSFISGLFINRKVKRMFNKIEQTTSYIGFHNKAYTKTKKTDQQISFTLDSITHDIVGNCFLLSSQLSPKKRILWKKGEVLYVSTIKKCNSIDYEEIIIPTRKKEGQIINLKEMSTSVFFRMLNRGVSNNGVRVHTRPDFIDKKYFFE